LVTLGLLLSGTVGCGGLGALGALAGGAAGKNAVRTRVGVPALFGMPDRPLCDATVAAGVTVGTVDEERLTEVSGLASSLVNPGLVWLMADGNGGSDGPRVWAVDVASGERRLQVLLPGELTDSEDLALGPCPDLSGPCVFVADTGDNGAERSNVNIIAFPEPTLTGKAEDGLATVSLDAVWTIALAFPDGESVDVEAMAILPDATAILLFEKTLDDTARIFAARSPWTIQTPEDGDVDNDAPRQLEQTGTVTLPENLARPTDEDAPFGIIAPIGEPVADLDLSKAERKARRITGADVHWSGKRLLLRTTGALLEYDDTGAGFFDLAGRGPRQVLAAPDDEAQGEAIGYGVDGMSWLSISEVKAGKAADGERPVLHRYGCGSVTP
jgi:hypothetical protein